ncbi:S9 family peptidase [soil metagenome]
MPRRFSALLFAGLLLIAVPGVVAPATAQRDTGISLEMLFASPIFSPQPFQGGRWADEGPVLTFVERVGGATHLTRLNLETDERTRLIDGGNLRKPDHDRALLQIEEYAWSADGRRVLLYTDSEQLWRDNTLGYYYVYDTTDRSVRPISDRAHGLQQFAKFDPAGTRVAFVRARDLFVVDLESGVETRLTHNGSPGGIINGTFDWVYEEEFGLQDGFEWSPDGRHISFFQLDESETRDFQMTDLRTLYPEYQSFRYPKAGEVNSQIRIGVIDMEGRDHAIRFFDTGTWNAPDNNYEYLALMGWTPQIGGAHQVWMLRLNRDQNRMDLLYGHPESQAVRQILREEEPAYIDVETGFSDVDMPKIVFLDDNERFIWRSDRTGFSHLYLYQNDGTRLSQVTEGNWDVTSFNGLDQGAGVAYFTATIDSPMERHLYRVSLTGGAPVRITGEPGGHRATLSSDFRYFLNTHSDIANPPTVSLRTIGGDVVTTLVDNSALRARLTDFALPTAEFTTVPAADGTELNAWVIRPSNFDPEREYPMLIFTYGGPGFQTVLNSWGGQQRLWFSWLAEQHGLIVASVDNRGTGGRGKAFKTLTQRRLGVLEAEDQIAAGQHFGRMPYIDADRIGIWGWSYGGFLSLLAMLMGDGPETFRTGIAVAPVTDWRLYDTIYTERYMSTPQINPEGYTEGSPVTYAANLRDHQNLLIVHGDADDNVHVQNAIIMADALQSANRQFDMMLYPGRNHGIYGGSTRLHLFTMMTRYLQRNLINAPGTLVSSTE